MPSPFRCFSRSGCRTSWLLLFFPLLLPAAPAAEPAPEPDPLLADAVAKLVDEDDCWAFTTATITFDPAGKPADETIERYDPSKLGPAKFVLLKKNGRVAPEKEVTAHAKQKQEEREAHTQALAKVKNWSLAHAKVVAETEEAIEFDLPCPQAKIDGLPYDKLRLVIRVQKASRTVEGMTLTAREEFRVMGIAKVKAMETVVRYAAPAPSYPPAAVSLQSKMTLSVLGKAAVMGSSATSSDYQRVQPSGPRPSGTAAILNALF